jgi:hypothetical protein
MDKSNHSLKIPSDKWYTQSGLKWRYCNNFIVKVIVIVIWFAQWNRRFKFKFLSLTQVDSILLELAKRIEPWNYDLFDLELKLEPWKIILKNMIMILK